MTDLDLFINDFDRDTYFAQEEKQEEIRWLDQLAIASNGFNNSNATFLEAFSLGRYVLAHRLRLSCREAKRFGG